MSEARERAGEFLQSMASALQYASRHVCDQYDDAVAMIERMQFPDEIFTTGIGKSGLIARRTASMFSTICRRATYLHPSDVLHGEMTKIGEDDVLICVSRSGSTPEILRLATLARQRNVRIISVACRKSSRLEELADVAIATDDAMEFPTVEYGADGLLPTTSSLLLQAILDALVCEIAAGNGFNKHFLQSSHPANRDEIIGVRTPNRAQ